MSFAISVPATDHDKFAEAVDAASPGYELTDEANELLSAAKEALKSLSEKFDGDKPVVGSISGHVFCQEGVDYPYDSVSLSLSECQSKSLTSLTNS